MNRPALSNNTLYALFPGLKTTIDTLNQQVQELMQTQADLQTALDAQEKVITQLQEYVAALGPAVDLTDQVTQVTNQTEQLQAMLPTTTAPTAPST